MKTFWQMSDFQEMIGIIYRRWILAYIGMFQGIMLQISKPIERSPMISMAKSEIRISTPGPKAGSRARGPPADRRRYRHSYDRSRHGLTVTVPVAASTLAQAADSDSLWPVTPASESKTETVLGSLP